MKLSDLRVDAAKGEAGAWVTNIPDMGEMALKVRALGNVDYQRLMAKLVDAVPKAKRIGGRVDPDERDRITNQCLLQTCLLDWRGLKDDDGRDLPFDRALAANLIMNADYAAFRNAVLYAASEVATQGVETLEEAEKN